MKTITITNDFKTSTEYMRDFLELLNSYSFIIGQFETIKQEYFINRLKSTFDTSNPVNNYFIKCVENVVFDSIVKYNDRIGCKGLTYKD